MPLFSRNFFTLLKSAMSSRTAAFILALRFAASCSSALSTFESAFCSCSSACASRSAYVFIRALNISNYLTAFWQNFTGLVFGCIETSKQVSTLNQISQPNTRWKALDKIYQIYMRPLHSFASLRLQKFSKCGSRILIGSRHFDDCFTAFQADRQNFTSLVICDETSPKFVGISQTQGLSRKCFQLPKVWRKSRKNVYKS